MKFAIFGSVCFGLLAIVPAFASDFSQPKCGLVVNSIPDEIVTGTVITVKGACLGDGSSPGEIYLDAEPQAIVEWMNSSITFRVQATAQRTQLKVLTSTGRSYNADIQMAKYVEPTEGGILGGVLNVRVKNGSPAEVASSVGAQLVGQLFPGAETEGLVDWWQMEVPRGAEESTLKALGEDPFVVWAEPVITRTPSIAPNDDCYDSIQPAQYCPSIQWGPQKISAPSAWDITKGSATVGIAVIDTGIVSHPDLSGKLAVSRDYTQGVPQGDSCGGTPHYGHGTHVAGIAAALTNNVEGIAGIGWESRVMSYRAFEVVDGECKGVAQLPTAIRDAADDGAYVINMSFHSEFPLSAERMAIDYAWSKGAVLVASAGNEGNTLEGYPAAYGNVISVSASDSNDGRASFSTYGAWVDVAAPGVGILSSVPPNGYGLKSGTSMAAPHVSGGCGAAGLDGSGQLRNCHDAAAPSERRPNQLARGRRALECVQGCEQPARVPKHRPERPGQL